MDRKKCTKNSRKREKRNRQDLFIFMGNINFCVRPFQEIELKPGSRATLKIDESSMNEPVIFSAHWTGEDKELFLNGNNTYRVKPKPDGNYTVEIAITDPGM